MVEHRVTLSRVHGPTDGVVGDRGGQVGAGAADPVMPSIDSTSEQVQKRFMSP